MGLQESDSLNVIVFIVRMKIITTVSWSHPILFMYLFICFSFFGKHTAHIRGGSNVLAKEGSGCGGAEFKSSNSLLAQWPLRKFFPINTLA